MIPTNGTVDIGRQSAINIQEIKSLKKRLLSNTEKFEVVANRYKDKHNAFIRISLTPERIIVERSDEGQTGTVPRKKDIVEKIIALYTHRGDLDFYEQTEKFCETLNPNL